MAGTSRHFVRVDGLVLDGLALVASVLTASCLLDSELRDILCGRRDAIYGTLAGVHGTLLGFSLAALTISLGYAQLERFKFIRESGQLLALYEIYLASVRTELLALVLAVGALLVDQGGAESSPMVGVVLGISVLGLLRLTRVLWVTTKVVAVIAKPPLANGG